MEIVEPIRELKMISAIETALRAVSERNWLLFFTGINTGLRISDLLKLRARDVQGKYIVLRETKTRKRQKIRIIPQLQKAFKRYTQTLDGRVFLFCGRRGDNQPLTRSGAYKLLVKAARSVGFYDMGCHTMRKTFGYHLYEKEKDVGLMQSFFNHASPRETLRYIGRNQDEKDRALSDFCLGGT